MNEKISRRQLLRSSAAAGVGLLMSEGGFPALAQEKEELDLPVGSAGKLTVIHRTEYFEAAQTLSATRRPVRGRQQRRARHFDDQPGVVRRLSRQDDRRGEGGQSARLRLHHQRLHPADAPARPGRGRDRRGRRGGQPATATSCRASTPPRTASSTGSGRPFPFLGSSYRLSRSAATSSRRQGIDPATLLKTFNDRREAALAISDPNSDSRAGASPRTRAATASAS